MSDDLNDRLSRRFESSDQESEGDSEDESRSANKSQTSVKEQTGKTSVKAQNIKKEWNVRSFYLDDELNSELTTVFKRLDFELSEQADIDLQKTRHFYPLVVQLGLERLDRMDLTEITERLED